MRGDSHHLFKGLLELVLLFLYELFLLLGDLCGLLVAQVLVDLFDLLLDGLDGGAGFG